MNHHPRHLISFRQLVIVVALIFVADKGKGQTFTCKNSLFIYKVKLDSTFSDDCFYTFCHVKSVSIASRVTNKVIQTVTVPENSFDCDIPKDQIFILQDVNFDGLKDIQVLQFMPAAPNIPYYFWTFNGKTKKFQRDTSLEMITSPEFDYANKIITSFWRSSCCDHGLSTYKYINGKPVLIEEVETAMDLEDNTKYITTVKRRINGKMKLVKRTNEKAEQ